MLLDIVILPPKGLSNRLGKLILKFAHSSPRHFLVDNRKLRIHLSIYHLNLQHKNLNKLVEKTEEAVKQFHPFYFKAKHFKLKADSVVAYDFYLNKEYKNLQSRILKHCSNLRSGNVPAAGKTRQEKELIKKYGSPYLLPSMRPHFTMGKLKKESDAKPLEQKLKGSRFKFLADTVAICKINKYFQVVKVIKVFKLK